MRVKDDESVSLGDITASVFRAYRNALQRQEAIDWDGLEEDQQAAWSRAVGLGYEVLEDAEGLPWTTLAGHMFGVWAAAVDYPERDWESVDLVTRSAWVAAGKHLSNVCAMEHGEDLEAHERRWIGAANRLGKPTP